MLWEGGYLALGKYDKGTHKLTPEIIFRVTITGGKEKATYEFLFDQKDSKDGKPLTHTITYWSAS